MKAIETFYKGYHFRSRLEARWAVFFDALNVQYRYEWEGYDLGGAGHYLPDYWLPEQQLFVEIKGVDPFDVPHTEMDKIEALRGRIVLFGGNIEIPLGGLLFAYDVHITGSGGESEWPIVWAFCEKHSRYELTFGDERHEIYRDVAMREPLMPCMHKAATWHIDEKILAAVLAARAARFEHGETPTLGGSCD